MKTTRRLFLSLPFALLVACSHPIEIVGNGDVYSASGTRTCYLEHFQAGLDNCTVNIVMGDYNEIYYAVARSGWEFDHWENCLSDDATYRICTFDVPAETVEQNFGEVMPPLVAIFKRLPHPP